MIDTYNIYDRCHCGARAILIELFAGCYVVKCSECAESIEPCKTKDAAMVAWNKERRKK